MSNDGTQDDDPMDSNEFDSLMDDIDDDDGGSEAAAGTGDGGQSAAKSVQSGTGQATARPDSNDKQSSQRAQTPTVDVGDSEPGFPFETQESVYLTTESWNNYDDLKHTVETYLRNEYDIRNVQGRELDEVFFRLAVERLAKEEIGDLIVRLRGFNPDSEP
jgi:hypothetical protein